MRKFIVAVWVLACCLGGGCQESKERGCFVGAFIEDRPTTASIEKFSADYGKRPAVVLMFLDWGKYPDETVMRDIYGQESIPMVTWEPWYAVEKQGIDYDAVLAGNEDTYIREFARRLQGSRGTVLLRFAHEMNGDWYPWSAQKIGAERYKQLFRHVREIFDEVRAANVRWVFTVNAENVPAQNAYGACYPGDRFVDYIGLDGYNWGSTQPWSRWRSFKEIFSGVYREAVKSYRKPVIVAEFSSTSAGGDKARWIGEALGSVRQMPEVKGLVLFNIHKETDWGFPPDAPEGRKLREGLANAYFRGAPVKDL